LEDGIKPGCAAEFSATGGASSRSGATASRGCPHEKRCRLCWPSDLEDDEGKQRSWHYFLLENLAASLTLRVSA
jgi:hypothetical protein